MRRRARTYLGRWAVWALLGGLGLLSAALLGGCRSSGEQPLRDGRLAVRMYLLTISTQQDAHYKWVEQSFEAANPDVDLIIEQFPGSSLKDYEIKLRLRFASGQAPDVFGVQENLFAELAALGLLRPAPDAVRQFGLENGRNDLVRQAPFYEGQYYGLVSDLAPTALYYNKAMFREAGLDPERPPATWDELLDYAERLTVRDAAGRITRAGLSLRKTGFKPGTADKWFTFLYSAGGRAFTDEGTRALFNSSAGRAALGFYREALFERRVDAVEVEGDQQGFGQGRVAMFIREPHVVRWLGEYYPDVDFGVAPIPKLVASLSAGGPYLWVVARQAPHPEAAWRVVRYVMSDTVQARYAAIGGVIPVTKNVAALPAFSDDPYLRVFIEQEMAPLRGFPRIARAADVVGAYVERFCYGHLTVDEALARMERDVNALLAPNRRDVAAAPPFANKTLN